MNNKGFTLMELLIVVAVMGTLGVIVTISMTASFNKTKQDDCKRFVKKLEDTACVYASSSNKEIACPRDIGCDISLNILNNAGLIDEEIDACTAKEIDLSKSVKVSWNQTTGEKKCYYNGVREYEK